MLSDYMERYLADLARGLAALDRAAIRALAEALMAARRTGRQVLIMGNGGSSAFASHMVNDLKKIVLAGQPRWCSPIACFYSPPGPTMPPTARFSQGTPRLGWQATCKAGR